MKSCNHFPVKLLFTVVLSVILRVTVSAQIPINYYYDDNGNRLLKSITLKKSYTESDTSYTKEIFKEELGEILVKIFPNPTHGDLIVDVTGLNIEAKVEFSLFSSKGTLLIKQKQQEHRFEINFNNYPAGVYFLKLNLKGEVSEWKIIKE